MKKPSDIQHSPMPVNLGPPDPAKTPSGRIAVAPQRVWVLVVANESGDQYGPWLFATEPSQERLEDFLRARCLQEFDDTDEDASGIFGSYLHIVYSGYREVNS